MTLAEQALAERFERLELHAASFRHRDHVETAYLMLLKYPFHEATARYASTIRTMATNAGAASKFHMTVTVAFLALIAERMSEEEDGGFEAFAERHPELFSPELLTRFYSKSRLDSELARRTFVMPDVRAD